MVLQCRRVQQRMDVEIAPDKFTEKEVFRLADHEQFPSLTIYLPMHRKAPESHKNPIRLKNTIKEATNELEALSVLPQTFLNPLYDLMDNEVFWQHQQEGLAIFLSNDRLDRYRLPLRFLPLTIISETFFLKPLLPLINISECYYVLSVDLEKPVLYLASPFHIETIPLSPDILGFRKYIDQFEFEKQVQFHTQTENRSRGKRPAAFHGNAVTSEETHKVHLLRYLSYLEKKITNLIESTYSPLIFVGLENIFSFYKEINTYHNLINTALEINPKDLTEKEIHHKTLEIAKPILNHDRLFYINKFNQLQNTNRTTIKLDNIIPKAIQGYVEALFVANDSFVWGTFDPTTHSIEKHPERLPGDRGLLDFAAVQTLKNSGKVFTLNKESVPGGAEVAAVLRYSIH